MNFLMWSRIWRATVKKEVVLLNKMEVTTKGAVLGMLVQLFPMRTILKKNKLVDE
jgi:hypothetical protein